MEQHPIKINKVQIRNLQIEDYVQLSQSFTRVYSDGSDVFWTREQIQSIFSRKDRLLRLSMIKLWVVPCLLLSIMIK